MPTEDLAAIEVKIEPVQHPTFAEADFEAAHAQHDLAPAVLHLRRSPVGHVEPQ
jgi:hypothetical protein